MTKPTRIIEKIKEGSFTYFICDNCEMYTYPQLEALTESNRHTLEWRIRVKGLTSRKVLIGGKTKNPKRIKSNAKKKDRELYKKWRAKNPPRADLDLPEKLINQDGTPCRIPPCTRFDNMYFSTPPDRSMEVDFE